MDRMRGHKYTDEEFLKIVRDTLTKHGSVPVGMRHIYIIGAKRYGSWGNTVLAATGKLPVNRTWTDAKLLDFIREVYKKTNVIPNWKMLSARNNPAYQEVMLRLKNIDDANEKAIGTSLRLEIFKAIEALTPPGCDIATTREVFAYLESKNIFTTTYSIGRMCRGYQNENLLHGKKTRTNTAWQLTEKGRQWIKTKN